MKICIPVEEDNGIDSIPRQHFKSAPLFIIYDTDTGATEVIENVTGDETYEESKPGDILKNKSIDVVFAGSIDKDVLSDLNSIGIKVYQSMPGTILGNIEVLKRGDLDEVTPETL